MFRHAFIILYSLITLDYSPAEIANLMVAAGKMCNTNSRSHFLAAQDFIDANLGPDVLVTGG